jgi:hypothetical protein
MGNGGVRGTGGSNPPSIPTDNINSAEIDEVSATKTPPAGGTVTGEKSSEAADNSTALREGAKEKGSFQDLAGKVLNADLQHVLDQKNAAPLNAEISDKLKINQGQIADPKTAANLVKDAANDPKVFAKILKEGTKESKELFGNAILSDPNLTNAKKAEMLQELTAAPKGKGESSVTIDDIIKNATSEGVRGLGKIITDPGLIMPSSNLLRGVGAPAITKALTEIHFDKSLTEDQKITMSRELVFHADKKDLDKIFSDNRNNLSFQDAIAAKDNGLLRKFAENISPQNMYQMADILTRTNPPRTDWLAHVASSLGSPDHMNATVDAVQAAGKLEDFLASTWPRAFFSQLTPQNAGAISAEYSRMAQSEKDPVKAKLYREYAAQADGMAENQFKKADYEEYVRVRDHYHVK